MTLYYPLEIDQGTTWALAFPVLDSVGNLITVDGWTARGQVRTTPTDSVLLHEWSAARTNIVVAGTTVTLQLTPSVSAAWTWTRGVYDLFITDPSGGVSRLAYGPVRIDQEVTR